MTLFSAIEMALAVIYIFAHQKQKTKKRTHKKKKYFKINHQKLLYKITAEKAQ